MRLRLTPRENAFYELFTAAGSNLFDTAVVLRDLVTGSAVERPALAKQLRDLEHKGDDRTHEIMRKVASTFVTPLDREDIYRLASRLDDVVDYFEAAGDLIILYDLEVLPLEMHHLAEILVRGAELTAGAMTRLKSLANLSDYWIEINRLENDADKLFRRFVARLFGGDYDALTVLKLKEIAEQLEAAADALEHVADTVESIAVKES
ncbi:MAG TPA: DUF47 family protein [Mycobacteriales bacterium]|nr:DUF47 family protein [Mycobacteriales bacterium]